MSDSELIKYQLLPQFFCPKEQYFQNLKKKVSSLKNAEFLLGLFTQYKVSGNQEFLREINDKKMFKDFYSKACENLDEKKIKLLENGIIFYDKKALLYCTKDIKVEDEFLNNIENIESISHTEYDLMKDSSKKSSISSGSSKKSHKSNSKENDKPKKKGGKMTGIENRAIALESLVNFNLKELNTISLPDLIFNLTYTFKNDDNSIGLFYEWDCCLLYKEAKDYEINNVIPFPFFKQKKYKINLNGEIEQINDNFFLLKNSINFIEVKTHFPKEHEKNEKQNINNIIKTMMLKLNYFVEIYQNLKIDIKTINIILLYNQNLIKNFKVTIKEYIQASKKLLNDKIKNYDVFFEIIYINPSIGKISLEYIRKKMEEYKNELTKSNDKIQSLEILYKKELNNKLNSLEIQYKNDFNYKLESLKMQYKKELNNEIEVLKAQHKKELDKSNTKIKILEEQFLNLQNKFNEFLQSGKFKKDNTVNNPNNDKIQEIKEIEKTKDKISNIKDKVQIFEPKIIQKNEINKLDKSIIINNKNQLSYNKNLIKINDNKNDEFSDSIYEQIKKKFALNDYEKVYVKMYQKFIENLDVSSASLIQYKNNHTSRVPSKITNAFHDALKSLTKDEQDLFFDKYNFKKCMAICSEDEPK